jgi:hypothetical protein
MRSAIFPCLLLLAGCAQLTTGDTPDQPKLVDASQHLLMTQCNGYASEFDVCNQAAKQACPAGYVVNEWVREYGSVSRRILFKCQ